MGKDPSGRTDRNGRFCFFPDPSGTWRVVVDDEIVGHKLELKIPLDKAIQLKTDFLPQGSLNDYFPNMPGRFMGTCVIFGIFGCILGWKG